jgi:hypothetical protein
MRRRPPPPLVPQVILKQQWSEKSDVWSFGVTMWEIFSNGAEPYADMDGVQVRIGAALAPAPERPLCGAQLQDPHRLSPASLGAATPCPRGGATPALAAALHCLCQPRQPPSPPTHPIPSSPPPPLGHQGGAGWLPPGAPAQVPQAHVPAHGRVLGREA